MNEDAIIYSKKVSSEMKSFCKPLKNHLGISLFVYFRAFKNDKYLMMSNDPDFNQDYISKIDRGNIFFNEYIDSESNYTHILWPKTPDNPCIKSYLSHGYWNGISLLPNGPKDYFECACFLADKNNESINNFYLKYPQVLEKFVDHFRSSFSNVISINPEDSRLAIFSKGFNDNLPPKNTEDKIHNFLKEMNINPLNINIDGKFIKLTKREEQCFELFVQGHSIKTMAKELKLSPRTIEVYLNNLKFKTGLSNRHSLVELYHQSI